jgi:Arylsulfotransferase (ASST)
MVHRHVSLTVLVLVWSAACTGSHESSGSGDAGTSVDSAGCPDVSAFVVSKNQLSSKIPTVGIVEWSLAGNAPSSAKIVYKLKNATSSLLNQGGEAPVNLNNTNYRTLLLGLKPSHDYTFHIEIVRGGATCTSNDYSLPTTGSYPNARPVTVQVAQASKREPGFIVTSSGTSEPPSAYIIDADGDLVWYADAPLNPTRAHMDYEGNNMWMIALNIDNWGGEMRYLSMDGENSQQHVPGFETAHHDFTVMPGGRVAALAWNGPGIDPESKLVIRSADGTTASPFKIGSNLYLSDTFHANAIHYRPSDDSFTIADRNPNVFVKVSATGTPAWQLGGDCSGAPVGQNCVPRDWDVVHGHHLLDNGTFLAFNNTYTDLSHVFEFKLTATPTTFSATVVEDYAGGNSSTTMGDVQRLPGGNTLITYSTDGMIVELDASWTVVQTFSARIGYTNWRPTLYGPPPRL